MRRTAIPGLVVLAILRLPSLMEPHWYTDEAGYVNVARQLLAGQDPLPADLEQQAAADALDVCARREALRNERDRAAPADLDHRDSHGGGRRVGGRSPLHPAPRARRRGDRRRHPGSPDRRRRAGAAGEPADRPLVLGGRDPPGAHPPRRPGRQPATDSALAAGGRGADGCGDCIPADVLSPRPRRSSWRCCLRRSCSDATPSSSSAPSSRSRWRG